MQVISSKTQRRNVIVCILQRVAKTGTSNGIAAAVVDNFPSIFPNRQNNQLVRSKDRKKSSTRRHSGETFIGKIESAKDGKLYVTSDKFIGVNRKRFAIRCVQGRGRKREIWIQFI